MIWTPDPQPWKVPQEIKAEIILWTAGFVLLTLIINASLLPWLLRVTKLNAGALPGLPAALLLHCSCSPLCAAWARCTLCRLACLLCIIRLPAIFPVQGQETLPCCSVRAGTSHGGTVSARASGDSCVL